MSEASKLKWANNLTAIVFAIATIQTLLTSPPFTTEAVAVLSGVFTYLVMTLTAWKQFLSPEINNTGGKITIAIAIAATITGLGNLIHVFNFNDEAAKWIKWGITLAVTLINILSKQLFSSEDQKDRMFDLSKKG